MNAMKPLRGINISPHFWIQ